MVRHRHVQDPDLMDAEGEEPEAAEAARSQDEASCSAVPAFQEGAISKGVLQIVRVRRRWRKHRSRSWTRRSSL